jgi:hypothetical protein
MYLSVCVFSNPIAASGVDPWRIRCRIRNLLRLLVNQALSLFCCCVCCYLLLLGIRCASGVELVIVCVVGASGAEFVICHIIHEHKNSSSISGTSSSSISGISSISSIRGISNISISGTNLSP